jgi:hypothetical protein
MVKRGSLFAGTGGTEPGLEKTPVAPATAPAPRATIPRPPSREGKSAVTFYVDPTAAKQLRRLCLDDDTSIQAVMVEALNDLFTKRGLGRIA